MVELRIRVVPLVGLLLLIVLLVPVPVESGKPAPCPQGGGSSVAGLFSFILPVVRACPQSQSFALVGYTPTGSLDTGFGTGGVVSLDVVASSGETATDAALQSDGRILVAGYGTSPAGDTLFAVARYNPDGGFDSTFGTGGSVLTDITSGYDYATSIALQPLDGKIVVAGSTNLGTTMGQIVVVRYNPDGTLDAGFGLGGIVITNLPAPTQSGISPSRDVAIQSDGKIVVGGYALIGDYRAFMVARYNMDGNLDSSFGSGGFVLTDVSPGSDTINSLVIQSDGKIVAAGWGYARKGGGGSDPRFALARYHSNGSLDNSFGTGGKVTADITSTSGETGTTMAILQDGKILVAGQGYVGKLRFVLARYTPAGSLDPGFGTGGAVTTDITGGHDSASALAIQADGRIVLAGEGEVNSLDVFALARYTSNGVLDSGFGTNGSVTTDIGIHGDEARAVVIQASGRIIAVGTRSDPAS